VVPTEKKLQTNLRPTREGEAKSQVSTPKELREFHVTPVNIFFHIRQVLMFISDRYDLNLEHSILDDDDAG
jgi:hypothetical protein